MRELPKLLEVDHRVLHFISSEGIQQPERLAEEFTKFPPGEGPGEDNPGVFTSRLVTFAGQLRKVAHVVGQDCHATFSSWSASVQPSVPASPVLRAL